MPKITTQESTRKLTQLVITREEAKKKLQDRIDLGYDMLTQFQQYDLLKKSYESWDGFNDELLKRIFTSDNYQHKYDWACDYSMLEGTSHRKLIKDIQDKIDYLVNLIDKLELIPTEIQSDTIQTIEALVNSKKVFIVHGRDELAKTNLEAILHEMNLEPIVLHRKADEGQTVIEKFEKHGRDVAYAFILLTPDEIAYLSSEDSLPDIERKKETRARPNVIFEFGYFVGKLGRNRVCCLYTGNVTLPSDLNGFVYKKYNTSIEEVAYSIQKDLKSIKIL